MSHVFVVVVTRDSEVEVCEAFSGLAALGRAFQLASDKSGRGRTDLFNHSPSEETLPDGSRRWVFMETNKQSVVVHYREVVDALLDSRDPNNVIGGLSNVKDVPKDVVPTGASKMSVPTIPARGTLHGAPIHDPHHSISLKDGYQWIYDYKYFKPTPPPFDFMDRSLPAGWNVDEKPILMGQFLDDPDNAKDPLFELTEEQKWALVKARIRKSPHFAVDLSGMVPSRDIALKAVEDRTDFGMKVRNADIKRLHDLLCDLIDGSFKSL